MMRESNQRGLFRGSSAEATRLSLEHGVDRYEVEGLDDGALILKSNGRLEGDVQSVLVVSRDLGSVRIPLDLSVSGQVAAVRGGSPIGRSALEELDAVIANAPDQGEFLDAVVTCLEGETGKIKTGWGRWTARVRNPLAGVLRAGAALGLCLVLSGTAVALGIDRYTAPETMPAFVVSNFLTIESPQTGHIVYFKQEPEFSAGEPLLVIESSSGRQVLVEAFKDGRIIERVGELGERVSRQDVILRLDDPTEPLVVKTILSFDRALRLSAGVEAELTFSDGETLRLPVSSSDIVTRWDGADWTTPSVELEIVLPAGYRQYLGDTVQLMLQSGMADAMEGAASKAIDLVAAARTWLGLQEPGASVN